MSVLNKPVKPYTFVDGVGNVAYGSQVNADFDIIYNKVGDMVDVINTTNYQAIIDSVTAAEDAQLAAEAAKAAAELALDSFDDRYLGVKSSDPTLDNDSNALVVGALYFNSATHVMRVYTGAMWQDNNALSDGSVAISKLSTSAIAMQTDLTNLSYPSSDGSYRDLARSGWLHAGMNQQWGGGQWGAELVDGATGNLYKFDVATGQIEDNVSGVGYQIGVGASTYYQSQGFVVSDSMTLDTVWLKLGKVGNPVGNLTVRIYSNNAGSPNAAIGSAATISCKLLTSKTDGEWYRISGLAASLVAGTIYHITYSLNTTDASNYVQIRTSSTRKYPFGFVNAATSTPAWTQYSSASHCFLIENPSSTRLLQTGGQFDQKLVFGADTYPSQIKALWQPLKNFFDSKEFTFPFRGTGTKGKPLADFLYGLDHDRVLLSCNTSTGYAQVDVWDAAGTKRTVTGTTDVSTGFHDVVVHVRAKGDGSDKIELFVDGVSQGTPLTGLTLTFDPLMRDLGNGFIGAGMPTAPTWTQKLDMSSLPSANGWTWAGTTIEANAMSVSGGKLYQNKNGYGATDTGYYIKSSAGLSNASGGALQLKFRVPSATNTQQNGSGVVFYYFDGVKGVHVLVQEYFLSVDWSGIGSFIPTNCTTIQGDFKSQENIFTFSAKGYDAYLFVNNKLVVDGTGKFTFSTVTNSIGFGDLHSTSGENADAIWDYVAYYTGGMLIPTAGGVCNEIAYFSGDKTSYLPALYNAGTPISIKQFTGQSRNYVGEGVVQKEVRRGVTSSPTTTSTTPVLLTDMECYVVGSSITYNANDSEVNSTAGQVMNFAQSLDGAILTQVVSSSLTSTYVPVTKSYNTSSYVGLHKSEARWAVGSGTATSYGTLRNLTVEARS